ncbi:GNAT family N-acetyltransferase [Alkalihalobacillus sp. MEB130]|uniref:GNAT family N-acetyltransferase n=1 Tax=Alkalihalobacillus sp. MEB130 TaxID=2976704 RepID=UPI0028DE27A4|nr:GNAT family N-acetyltransferase [Alkalihalobacillus sp. MEB130]MDT8859632.1 GNAT family N-acetyltransferase [Alkalihalobacillus sp. MEB130]
MIRPLAKEDVERFKELRLEALKEVPEAFAASYEEEVDKPLDFFVGKLLDTTTFYGVFEKEGELLGMISLTRSTLLKMKHKGAIGSVYIAKKARGRGLGKELFTYVMKEAEVQGIEQLQLVVAATNEKAKHLYESLGFYVYGFEKRALKMKEQYIDEEYMMRLLT